MPLKPNDFANPSKALETLLGRSGLPSRCENTRSVDDSGFPNSIRSSACFSLCSLSRIAREADIRQDWLLRYLSPTFVTSIFQT